MSKFTHKQRKQLYLQFLPAATKIGATFAKRHGMPIHQMVEETHSILADLIATWNEHYDGSSTPCTWIHIKIRFALRTYYRKQDQAVIFSTMQHPIMAEQAQTWSERLSVLMQDLSEDAKTIITAILEAPGDVVEELTDNVHASPPERFQRYVRRRHKMPLVRMQWAWNEVRTTMGNYEIRNNHLDQKRRHCQSLRRHPFGGECVHIHLQRV